MHPVRFRLYPGRARGLYVLCQVWPTRAAMRDYGRQARGLKAHSRTEAFCSIVDRVSYTTGRRRAIPVFAECNFHRRSIGTEVITHELFHATMAWARRVEFDFQRLTWEAGPVNEDEERLTYVHSTLCRRFVDRAIALGLYD